MTFLIGAPNKLTEVLHLIRQYEEEDRREQLVTASVHSFGLCNLS